MREAHVTGVLRGLLHPAIQGRDPCGAPVQPASHNDTSFAGLS